MANTKLRDIALYFLKLGLTGFGGPFAVIAMIQRDLVQKKHWLTNEKFSNAFALIKALPGPTATLLAIYIGQHRAGRLGGFLAGFCFVLPSFLMMLLLAVFYEHARALKNMNVFFEGLQASALGVIMASIFSLAQPYLRISTFWIVALLSTLAATQNPSIEPALILLFGLLGVAYTMARRGGVLFAAFPLVTNAKALPVLGATFFKAGAFVFGTGLAIVPLLSHDVVQKYRWLTNTEFLDALALGQATPGPVLITSTFIGFHVSGLLGACLTTVAVFAPAFFHMLTWFPWAEKKILRLRYISEFLQWAIAAVIGAILAACFKLGKTGLEAHVPAAFYIIGICSLILCRLTKLAPWILFPAAGLINWIIFELVHST